MGGQTMAMTGSGSYDMATKTTAMDLDLSSFAKTLSGLTGGTAPGLEGFDDPGNWKLSAIQVDKVMLMRFPLLEPQLGGKHWVKLDLETLARASGTPLGQFGSFGASDPRDMLKLLDSISGSIEPLGSDTIRDVTTHHYVAMVDPSKLAGLAGKQVASQDIVAGMTQSFSQLGLGVIPVHVWLDEQHRVRRLTLDVSPSDTSAVAAMGEMKVIVSFELFDYGVPATISMPPAEDIADGATLMR